MPHMKLAKLRNSRNLEPSLKPSRELVKLYNMCVKPQESMKLKRPAQLYSALGNLKTSRTPRRPYPIRPQEAIEYVYEVR